MTHTMTVNPDGTTTVAVDFTDEGVSLTGETHVRGGETEALRYLSVYEADLRRNYAHLFPQPKPEPLPPEEGMML